MIGRPGDLIPDQLSEEARFPAWLVTGPDPVTAEQISAMNQIGATVVSREVGLAAPDSDLREGFPEPGSSSLDPSGVGISAVVIGLVLLQIALLAGPAIAVGARRNQRGLAILASTGAERRQLRAVVLAGSGVVGLLAGLAGAVLGAGLGAVIARVMMRYDNQQIVRIDINAWDLLALALVGGVTAVAAALVPAWQVARLDVVAVITGRRGQKPSLIKIPLFGLILAVVGMALAYGFATRRHSFLAVGSLALAEIGMILAVPAAVALAARAAVRFPFATRFALRDAARQRNRTVPAVAAVLAAVAGASCALVYLASAAEEDRIQYAPTAPLGSVMVRFNPAEPGAEAAVEAAVRQYLPVKAVASYQVLQDPADGHTFLEAVRPPENVCPESQLWTDESTDRRCQSDFQAVSWDSSDVFDDGSAYPLLTGHEDAVAVNALRAGRVLVSDPLALWPDGTVHLKATTYSEKDQSEDVSQTVVLPGTLVAAPPVVSLPMYPPAAAEALGVSVSTRNMIVDTSRMPTPAEEEQADEAVRNLGGFGVEAERGYRNAFALGLLAVVIAAAVVGLGGTFTAVGLAAAESRSDVATLAAVGASPAVRRRLAAAQAGVIAGLGSVLGVGSGIVAGWVLIQLDESTYSSGVATLSTLPWPHLLATGIGIPVLAIGIGYLSTRSRLPLVRRLGQ